MKTLKFTFSAVLIVLSHFSFAQTGSWKLAGNSLAGTEKIGSKNNFPINFITNNVTRMSLTPTGQLGIGTSAPEGNLHIFRGSAGTVTANPNAPLVVENSTDNFINLLTPSNKSSAILFGNPLLAEDGGIIYNNPNTVRGFQFNTSNNTKMVLTNSGSLGIGTINPEGNLHVFRGSAGTITANPNSPLVVESSTDNFINLLTPGNKESAILFGSPLLAEDGGIIYNNPNTSRGFQFNTNSNKTRMVLTNAGFLGVGAITPKSELHVLHGDGFGDHGLRLQHTSGKLWNLYTAPNGNLQLFIGPDPIALVGEFSGVNGEYTRPSDLRMKKDIEKAPEVLSKVMQLEIKKYHFLRNKPEDKKSYGMIAQEVEKIFPKVVYHNKINASGNDYYMMNYEAFGVLAIKAIQEQQMIIEKLKSDIEELKQSITQSSSKSDQSSKNITKTTLNLSAAHLNQNTPNPFNSNTIISYYVPEKSNASIEIVSSNGQLIKTYPVTQKGNGQLSIKAGELSTGTYHYVLMADGVKVDSKQMVFAK